MKSHLLPWFFVLVTLTLGLTLHLPLSAEDAPPLIVIATIPDLADMANEVGGEHVTVESMARGMEDPHAVPVKPSLAAKLSRADIVIEIGLACEHAYLPALLEACNNPKLKLGEPGHIVASDGVTPLDVPERVSRTEGEQHPEGNPHVNVGPGNGKIMAKNIYKGLAAVAPQWEPYFKQRLDAYLKKIAVKEAEWKKKGAALQGLKYVSFHPDFVYFADYFGMTEAGTIEPKPGIPPSAGHTAELIKMMKAQAVKLILREPQYADALPNAIAEQTGAKVAKIAVMVHGVPEAKTWIDEVDTNLDNILKALNP